jgi:hypothetical protein
MIKMVSEKKGKTIKCSLCGNDIEHKRSPLTGKVYWTQGNNAQPLNDGRCCDVCNDTRVIPARMGLVLK